MKRILLLFVLLLTIGVPAFAQATHTVTGKILDQNGVGFPGAAITVKGMQIGTVSDASGDFMLDVPEGSNQFIIQAMGYNTRTVTETDGSIMVKLTAKAKELEGTVVTAQAINREKRQLGYNTTTLNNEQLNVGNNSSTLTALNGKVAGANVTSSTGAPGGSTRVVLRGEKSILKNNNALIVVDGVITNNFDRTQSTLRNADKSFSELTQIDFGNSANDIDPEDIESITVLEGPAASVLYGASGANGALMITTKTGRHNVSGKPSKMDVTFKSTYYMSDILKFADMQHDFGQGNIYNGVPDDRRENFSWGYKFDNYLRPWGQIIDGKQLVKPYSDQPDNIRSFFDHGKTLSNFVSLSGGTENSTYYLSLNALNNTGAVPNTFYNRYSVRFNGSSQLTHNLYSSININYINNYSRAEGGGQGSGSVLDNLYQIPRDIPVWELKNYGYKYYSMQFADSLGIDRYGQYAAYTKNPYWAAKYYDNRNKTDRVLGAYNIGWKKGSFNVYDRVGIDVNSDRSYYKTPSLNSSSLDPFYVDNIMSNPGGYTQSNINSLRLYNDVIANYTHDLGENFGINAILGHNTTMQTDELLAGIIDPATNGLVIPNFYNLQNNTGPVISYNALTRRRTYGVYADIAFNYRRELYWEVTGRNDWSSTLNTDRNSYFYPGANAAWVFTERLKGTNFKEKVLDYGKVRIGAAGVGNDAMPYANNNAGFTQSSINTSFGSIVPPFNGMPAYQVGNTFGDPNLKPEQTREIEMGTDLSFFKDRLSVSFTYYRSLTRNLITLVPLPASSGFGFNYLNVGDISNRGQEISLRGTPISTKYGLKWDLFGTFTHNVNNVESLTDGVDHVVLGGYNGMEIVAAKGHPFGTFYASEIQYWKDPKTGIAHAVVDPNTGLPLATKTPLYFGSYQPKFQASWGTELTYKGIKLYALFVTKQGGQFYSRDKMIMDFVGTSQETTINNRNPLVWANSVYQVGETGVYLPNTTKYSPYQYFTTTEQQSLPAQGLVNASYVKLQEVALSYKVPKRFRQHTPFGGLELGVFGNNLFIWTATSNKYNDPEETSAGAIGNGQGFNFTARPTLRNYGAFLKVNF